MNNFTQQQPRSFDPVAAALTTVGIERDHSLYPLLYEAAAMTRQHRLPVNVETLAFTIAKTPALQEGWTARVQDEDTVTQRIREALTEYPMPAVGREAA
jgi:hypothetical protein